MTTFRKDVRATKPGDRFRWNYGQSVREVVRVRAVALQTYHYTGAPADKVPGVEIMHRSIHRPGVDYLEAPIGSQLAILVQ